MVKVCNLTSYNSKDDYNKYFEKGKKDKPINSYSSDNVKILNESELVILFNSLKKDLMVDK